MALSELDIVVVQNLFDAAAESMRIALAANDKERLSVLMKYCDFSQAYEEKEPA